MDCTVICIITDDTEDRTLTSRLYEDGTVERKKTATPTEMKKKNKKNTYSEKRARCECSNLVYQHVCMNKCACRHCLLENSAFVNSHYGGMHALHIDTHIAILCIVRCPQEKESVFRDISESRGAVHYDQTETST